MTGWLGDLVQKSGRVIWSGDFEPRPFEGLILMDRERRGLSQTD